MKNNKRWLITVDLDGTLLKDSTDEGPSKKPGDYSVKILKELVKMGHKVSIVTGRPWRDTKLIYEQIGLNTIVSNYNGANIHKPGNEDFDPIWVSMNNQLFKELLNKEEIKRNITNFLIEGKYKTYILDNTDKEMLRQFHITKESEIEKCGYDFVPKNSTQTFVFKLNKSLDINIEELLTSLRRDFYNSFVFRLWVNKVSKTNYIEVNAKNINKGFATQMIASYYNISMRNTISFGDGHNDIEMLSISQFGIAMKNADDIVKSYSTDVTDYTNNQDGVGKFLSNFFKIK